MSWNYRVVRKECRTVVGTLGKDSFSETVYAIHECYYDNDGKRMGLSRDPIHPQGETREELEKDLRLMMQALDSPVMEYHEI